MRESRSRPRLSVPSQCVADIGPQTSPTISPLPYGAIQGAKIAASTNSAVSTRPISAGMGMRFMSSTAPPLFRMSETRIGDDRRYVRNDVQADVDGGEDQADRLHHRHVAFGDVVDEIL